ncbi:Peptidyl-prolyl cis-trans isomerase FKBP62 [Striga hermonthica]|uniref:peptidylprolyl isomerase n=1 Tax=Striga hermonthica TaxID=68872 RepID=A0A9N7NMD7_STRHE|nr:Peptidyl-prolyl cis-trans isomerase FKBP62 [Striga hermonthica]
MDEDFDLPAAGMDEKGMDPEKILKVGEEREIGGKGLKKQLLKEGDGWENPKSGDEVEVNYVGTLLDGTKFDSSLTPLKFRLGQGDVIKGWDEGIQTMKKNEKALFTIPPELAYGALGSPPKIPPNSTLKVEVELLSWISWKDICKDGGLLKKVLVEGEGWQNPRDPDEVFVKFEVQLEDGTAVLKQDAVEFTVREVMGAAGYNLFSFSCHFCPALSKAVKTMKKGEKAHLLVKPQYGFGEKGKPAAGNEFYVPPNATLQINLKLVSWKIVSDISHDKKILKKILREGEGYERPHDGATVRVKLTGKLHDGTIFARKGHDFEPPLELKVDEDQVIEGLDRALKTMKKGEVAIVVIQPEYAFGQSESLQELAVVPGNSTVYYEVEMISFDKEKESWDMSADEKIDAAGKKKEEGNVWYRAGKYQRASKRYEKAISFIDYDSSFSEEEKERAKVLKVSCKLNNAACKLKLKSFKETVKLCSEVLEIDGRNVKALYRRAQAYIDLVELELAEKDIKNALEIDPDNRDVKKEYKILKEKVKEYDRRDAQFYGNIIAKMKKSEPVESLDPPKKQGSVSEAIDRIRRSVGGLAEKAVQTYKRGRNPGSVIPARLVLTSLLMLVLAVVLSFLCLRN